MLVCVTQPVICAAEALACAEAFTRSLLVLRLLWQWETAGQTSTVSHHRLPAKDEAYKKT